jgi:adenine-specific DNA-methyltransferase
MEWPVPALVSQGPGSVATRADGLEVPVVSLIDQVEATRSNYDKRLSSMARRDLGQVMTPWPVASFMASLIPLEPGEKLTLLDPGAGVGSLSAAVIERAIRSLSPPSSIHVIAYEIDDLMVTGLEHTLRACRSAAQASNVDVSWSIRQSDFLTDAARISLDAAIDFPWRAVDAVILNPPYLKIGASSAHRRAARAIGVETSNLYAAFLSAAIVAAKPMGHVVAITPRSFCNGTYFRSFRRFLLDRTALQRFHVFASRSTTFRDNSVLQETVISHFVVGGRQRRVNVSESNDPLTAQTESRPFADIVHPDDPQLFIRLPSTERETEIAARMSSLPNALEDLGLKVSTGRVVDFRAIGWLRRAPETGCVPLLYPHHLRGGQIGWPMLASRKPNAIVETDETRSLLIPSGDYTLVKRFTSKEERRRVVATWLRSEDLDATSVGLENHLNYFHASGMPLDCRLAGGLTCYLNSSLVDEYFRTFSGHTQVNAGDLRSMRYPSEAELVRLHEKVGTDTNNTAAVDQAISSLGL